MSSWYSSWLPSLPSVNFAIPSSLQGRFVSFLLKKCLGHFLKPGQLDARQIESQIGSGFVQVNDLELNSEAINSFLAGLPLVVHDGYISSITARVPWPNPLTSNLGLSLDALHLTFHVVPTVTTTSEGVDLSDSVASATEAFMHEELIEHENITLSDSVHSNVVNEAEHIIPGGLDSFVSNKNEVPGTERDAAGASLFTSLVDKLLARFEFKATNARITLVDPDNISLTLSITEIHYGTEANIETAQISAGVDRQTLTISGVAITTQDLRPHDNSYRPEPYIGHSVPVQSSLSPFPPYVMQGDLPPISPATSLSSLEGEAREFMLQSLASLPPRTSSIVDSASSSLYQSALSEENVHRHLLRSSGKSTNLDGNLTGNVEEANETRYEEKRYGDAPDNVLCTFGPMPLSISFRSLPSDGEDKNRRTDNCLCISVNMGVIALAIHAWQLAGIITIIDRFNEAKPSSHIVTQRKETVTPPAVVGPNWDFNMKIGGLVVLVLPGVPTGESHSSLASFFDRSVPAPYHPCGYVRFYAGDVVASSSKTLTSGSHQNKKIDHAVVSIKSDLTFKLRCTDVNAFVHSFSSPTSEMIVYPFLFTDQHLRSQYAIPRIHPKSDAGYIHLPTFTVSNSWFMVGYQDAGIDLSSWRVALPSESAPDNATDITEAATPQDRCHESVVYVNAERIHAMEQGKQAEILKDDVSISVLPLHLLLDVTLISNKYVMSFLQELTEGANKDREKKTSGAHTGEEEASNYEEQTDNFPPKDTVQPSSEGENERKRLERLVLEDFNLPVDFLDDETAATRTSVKRRTKDQVQTSVSVTFMMVRVELRCSPPSGQLPRSGILVIDFHDLKFISEERRENRNARFITTATQTPLGSPTFVPVIYLQCDCILFAFCPVASIAASSMAIITSLDEFNDQELTSRDDRLRTSLKPRISVLRAVHPSDTALVTVPDVNIPSIYLSLRKEALDGLLFLADDATQLMDRTTALRHIEATNYSASPLGHGSQPSDVPSSRKARPLRINISVTDVIVRLMISSSDHAQQVDNSFDIYASDIILSVELKPESMEQSVADVEVIGLSVKNKSRSNKTQTILSHTAPRNMSSPSKPLLKLSFASLVTPQSGTKETRLKLTLYGITGNLFSDVQWFDDLNSFMKSPPGVFESVIPSEKTSVILRVQESSIHAFGPTNPGALLFHIGDLEFMTDVIGNVTENTFNLLIPNISLLSIDDLSSREDIGVAHNMSGVSYWRSSGYALIAEATGSIISFRSGPKETPDTQVAVEQMNLRLHFCADTITAVSSIVNDWQQNLDPKENKEHQVPRTEPAIISERYSPPASLTSSAEDFASQRLPEIGPVPDMINDDLPTNLDYLDESFSAAAGLRELYDEDLDDFKDENDFEVDLASPSMERSPVGLVSRVRGETVKMMRPEGIQVIENFFDTLPADTSDGSQRFGDAKLRIRIHDCNLTLCLYDGYDWSKTRRTIEREVKDMRRRLAKFRQLVASGQVSDSSIEEMSTVLFNSVYIGLDQDVDNLEPVALIAAIDEQLNDDIETASQSSWQSLRPHASGRSRPKSIRVHGKRLMRSRGPSMEFVLSGVRAEIEHYDSSNALVSRILFTIKDIEILDHIKTSTWRKFLTALQLDSRGNTRETGSSMARIELRNVRPVPGHPAEEVRLRAKILPLRLYVDQDAVDFLKKFFSFKDPNAMPNTGGTGSDETYIQFAEVFPVVLKLDYKPRRVDYKALREGRTIELMNFFHFDGAEMTLRHITLSGIMGWSRFFELLNDLWTPDVKATQLVDVISGVSPIRSVVNVGSGVADLVLLPIAQYKKDGRILRGLQKGTTAFFKSTALEAIKLGAKLATGTQVILEQAEGVLGGEFQQAVTTEAIQEDIAVIGNSGSDDERPSDIISKYADQPKDIKEGVHYAYKSLRKNFSSAAQTILAVPMEVYERSGDEGAIRSVIRAVPIAVLKPMIGATEAVSKTLLGLHNTLDSNVRHDNEAKYKQR
ncbi:hypothetical protein AX15_005189 [Amanita polypyramis BW_CC]|nr:hypothetical protein AX15_005189 [Amanita polypyramis BW_CC]